MPSRHVMCHFVLVAGAFCFLITAPQVGWAGKRSCVVGTEPEVAGDLDDIATLKAQIHAVCPCANYDGSGPGSRHSDFVRCAKTEILAAVTEGNLRQQCKGTVKKIYAKSTCGFPPLSDPAKAKVPCVKQITTNNKVICAIKPQDRCVDRPGKFTQQPCADFDFCLDAADDNGNFLFLRDPTGGDDGECRSPVCGDGFVNTSTGEECDDGNTDSCDGCSEGCQDEGSCGDGDLYPACEACDDGNTADGDCCSASCDFEPPDSGCPDDGNACTDDLCNATGTCTHFPNTAPCNDADGCTQSDACDGFGHCVGETVCGNGVLEAPCGEECDDGVANSNTTPDACRTDCSNPTCGDGVSDPGNGETCDGLDDANCPAPPTGRGCAWACTCSSCGDGTVSLPVEQCDLADPNAATACAGQPCGGDCTCPAQIHAYDLGGPAVSTSFHTLWEPLGPGSSPRLLLTGTLDLQVGPDLAGGSLTPFQALVPQVGKLDPSHLLGIVTFCFFFRPLDPNDPTEAALLALAGGSPTAAGLGYLDCVGSHLALAGRLAAAGLHPDPDYQLFQDHCTGGSACDSFPNDGPPCHPSLALGSVPDFPSEPDGLPRICVSDGAADPGCVLGTLEGPNDPHPGVCNGPLVGPLPGVAGWRRGDAFVFLNLAIDVRTIGDECLLDPNHPLGLPPTISLLTTGTATSGIMDAFALTDPNGQPAGPGFVQSGNAEGIPFDCPALLNNDATGASLVSTVPLVDSASRLAPTNDENSVTNYDAR